MSSGKVLTRRIAEQFLADPDAVDLSEFTAIVDEAAELLLEFDGKLSLFGLENVRALFRKQAGLHAEDDYEEKIAEYVDDAPRLERPDVPGTIINSIGLKLAPITAGTFMMGSPGWDDAPQHKVTLSQGYYLGLTQITQAQYAQVMGENPSSFQGDEVSGRDSSEFPVEEVSWHDSVEFCRKLSELPAEKAAGRVYRLPTEAEWEYACRAGTTTKYSFGDDEASLGKYAWYNDNSGDRTHPVGLKEPNPWGLYDMHGNVWEWCSDWFERRSADPETDPIGPPDASDRILRGGSWNIEAASCRSADRYRQYPSIRLSISGFRVALSSSGIPE